MDFEELLSGLGRNVGLHGLKPDDDRTCRISIDGMSVTFTADREGKTMLTYAEVGERPPEGVTTLYRVMMESMFMGQTTGGSTFSVDPATGKIYLHRADLLGGLDVPAFMAMVEKFVNVLEQWRSMVADYRPSDKDKDNDSVRRLPPAPASDDVVFQMV